MNLIGLFLLLMLFPYTVVAEDYKPTDLEPHYIKVPKLFKQMVDKELNIDFKDIKPIEDVDLNKEVVVQTDELQVQTLSQDKMRYEMDINGEVHILESIPLRTNSGAERQFGRPSIELEVRAIKPITSGGMLKEVQVYVNVVPKSIVVNTNEEINGNNVNAHWNNNGLLSRPWYIGGFKLKTVLPWGIETDINGGVLKTHGLENLALTQHQMFGSRGLRTGYNTGFEADTRFGDIMNLRLGINNGEWRSGSPDALREPKDRANSQPGGHYDVQVNLSRLLDRVGPGFMNKVISKNRNIFVGATGNKSTSGSLSASTRTGEKQVQDDQIIYAGLWQRIGERELVLRVYKSEYHRDKGTGCGRNCPPAVIEGKGVELRLNRVMRVGRYDVDVYATDWSLESNSDVGDPEFFPQSPLRKNLGVTRTAEGQSLGVRLSRERFFWGVNLAKQEFDNPLPIINGNGEVADIEDDLSISLVGGFRFGKKD